VARLGELVHPAGNRLGRIQDREPILAGLGMRQERILHRWRDLAGSSDDRDLVDLVHALEAGARARTAIAADIQAVAATATDVHGRRGLVVLLVTSRSGLGFHLGSLGRADIDDEAPRATIVEEAVDRVREVFAAVLEVAERLDELRPIRQ